MTQRHRYRGPDGGLCGERFGGVATCNVPLRSEWHWQNDDHPWSGGGPEDECSWVMQGVAQWAVCGRLPGDDVHSRPQDVSFTEPVTLVMQYPRQEVAPAVPLYGGDSPEGAGEAMDMPLPPPPFPSREQLEKEAQQYAWRNGDTVTGPIIGTEGRSLLEQAQALRGQMHQERLAQKGYKEPEGIKIVPVRSEPEEWELAVRWLETEGVGLVYGPWPVRKFLLPDMPEVGDTGDHRRDMRRLLEALDVLEVDYVVSVYRPEEAGGRVAVVTWDWALGMGLEAVCDELSIRYG